MPGVYARVCLRSVCRKRHGEVLCFSYEQQKRGSGVFHYFLLLHGTVFSSRSSVGFRSCSRAGLIVLHGLVEREGKLSSRQQSVFVGVFVPPSSVLHISQPCEQQKEQKELCAPALSFPLVPSSHLLSPSPHSLSLSPPFLQSSNPFFPSPFLFELSTSEETK